VAGDVTRKTDVAAVQGQGVALDRDDVVAGGGQGQDELAVTRAYDHDRGVAGCPLSQYGQELGEEGEGVLP
jgi:hypothetical protein